jgi:hypothetical protein
MFAMSTVPAQEAGRGQGPAWPGPAIAGTVLPPQVEKAQQQRLSDEVSYLLTRIREQSAGVPAQLARVDAELEWWLKAESRSLLDGVQRSFLVRQLCLRLAASDGTWRNSLSYIGDTDPADEAICTYDYDRAEIRYTASSPLASPYAWTASVGAEVQTWYARTGMSAITAWLISTARIARDAGRRCTIFTNRLYHETAILFELARLEWVEVRVLDDCHAITAAARAAEAPAVVFLDSSRPDGDVGAVGRILRDIDPERVGCVVWDNTCAPADAHPFADGVRPDVLRTSLLLLRSHAKLDQLGLEFCALGSLALMSSPAPTDAARGFIDGLANYLPDALAVSGGCASPTTLRLLAALGLPEPELSATGNRALRAANALGAHLLRSALEPSGRYVIEENEHRCFAEIHVLDLPGPPDFGAPAVWGPWEGFDRLLTEVERHGAAVAVPIWKSASFGFHYTGLSWYPGEDPPFPGGERHTVLRPCFGMHDPEIIAQIVEILAEHLLGRADWAGGA